jgi:hypothetical protein
VVVFEPFPKQQEFIKAVFSGMYRYLFYGGGARGGKSYVCMAILILLCKFFKNSKWHVMRRDTTRLEKTSIPTFHKVCPRRFLKKFVGNVAYFTNGSEIHFVPENYDRDKDLTWMDGVETNGFLLEEVQELNKKTFNKAKLRAGSHIIDPMPPILVLCTGNPSQNWSKDTFVNEPLVKDKELDLSQWVDGELKAPYFFKQSLMSDNPVVPEEYKKSMENLDTTTYKKFVLGDWDIIDVEKPFAYAFNSRIHIGKLNKPSKSLPLYLSFDFNVDPITCLVGQHSAKWIRFHKEYRLRNSNIYALCEKIKEDWGGYYFYVTGDASGNNRSAMVQGNLTYYKIIKSILGLEDTQMRVPTHNPGVANNRVLVNSLLEKFPTKELSQQGAITFDAEGCPFTIKDMQYCEVDRHGQIDKTKDKHMTHLIDCCKYYLDTWFFSWLKGIL